MDNELYKLSNVDPLDMNDVILKVESSFDLKFDDNIFKDVKTFGELCDVIQREIKLVDSESCTTQQAYYKLRNAIAKTINLDKHYINPRTDLSELLASEDRRKITAGIDSELGFKTDLLRPREGVIIALVLLFIASLIKCFFGWQVGLAGIFLSIVGLKVANLFGKEISVKTVGDLARKISRENYLKARRNSETVNRKEIEQIINDLFTDGLDLDPKSLTRNTSFV
jgi:hypothetical protein